MKPRIVATVLVRRDDWCLEFALAVATLWCDHAVVLLHEPDGPDERCRAILKGYPQFVTMESSTDPDWQEMRQRQRLLEMAREQKATHVAIIDADEALTGSAVSDVYQAVCALSPGEALSVPMVAPYGSLDISRHDGSYGSSRITLAFADRPDLHWADQHDTYCFHQRPPRGISLNTTFPSEARHRGLFHFQFVSRRRLIAKAVYYKLIETLRWPGRMTPDQLNQKYDWTLRGEPVLKPISHAAWNYPIVGDGHRHLLRWDGVPWQEEQAILLLREWGLEKFRDINLHGLMP